MFAQSHAASTMSHQGLWATSQELRSIFAGSMGRGSGSVKNVQRDTQCSLTGRLISRHVRKGIIDVTVALFSLGTSAALAFSKEGRMGILRSI